MKYLLFGLLAYLAWRWYTAQRSNDEPAVQAPPSPAPSVNGPEKMVSCAQCGVYLPQSEAISGVGELHFCSTEHRHQYSQASGQAQGEDHRH